MNLTECKINLLKYGVKFSPITLFNKIDSQKYKLKLLNKIPKTNGRQVFDISEQNDMIPAEILLEQNGNKSLTKLRYSESSPIELKLINNEKLELEYNNKKINIDCSLVKYNPALEEKIPTEISKQGFKVGDYISVVGLNRVTILFYDGCFNWLTCKNCKFCDLHPVRSFDKVARPTINDIYKYKNIQEWWNSQRKEYINCIIFSLQEVLKHFKGNDAQIFFMAGNLENNEQTWKITLDVLKEISKVIDLSKFTNYVNIAPHDSLDNVQKIKDLGINNVQYNLEVSSENLFKEYCPGKMPYKTFVNKLIEAVKVMGKNHVRSNFVLGLEDPKDLLQFADKIGEKGIVVDYSVFQPKKGTQLYSHPTLPFDDVLDFSEELCKLYKKYNQKPIFSSVSSRSSIMNELYMEI